VGGNGSYHKVTCHNSKQVLGSHHNTTKEVESAREVSNQEARELFTKLLATSKQVLGSHHKTTKEVESTREVSNQEARELFTKLLATSKQVLGSHLNTTKEVESALKQVVSECEVSNQG
jgi:hypothetical protein